MTAQFLVLIPVFFFFFETKMICGLIKDWEQKGKAKIDEILK